MTFRNFQKFNATLRQRSSVSLKTFHVLQGCTALSTSEAKCCTSAKQRIFERAFGPTFLATGDAKSTSYFVKLSELTTPCVALRCKPKYWKFVSSINFDHASIGDQKIGQNTLM
jgi:hypothetical protein